MGVSQVVKIRCLVHALQCGSAATVARQNDLQVLTFARSAEFLFILVDCNYYPVLG